MTRALEICIATCDIVGPIKNGGIGTAYYNLALTLARAGHAVTVVYALGRYCEHETIEYWVDHYRRLGIALVPLPPTAVAGHSAVRMSYSLCRWLESQRFDVVHCHEWRGLPFYTALAKRQGLILADTTLCIGVHSPTLWHLEGMKELADPEALEVDFMEREAVARGDVIWSPSRHMVQWMRREGWTLPRRVVVKPYLLLDVTTRAPQPADSGSELVFFGRLETRKGLDIFCDAVDVLEAHGTRPRAVTFMGKAASVGGAPSLEYLARRAERWTIPWSAITDRDRDAAIAYLRAPDRIAVLPSRIDNLPYTVLECLGSGVPLLAAATGGIPELVAPADAARVLFACDKASLAEKLTMAVRDGLHPSRLRVGLERIERDWLDWHTAIGRQPRSAAARRQPCGRRTAGSRKATRRPPQPLVSVCITHHDRPALLDVALESIRRQDYPNIEVVLVDDGSTTEEAVRYIGGLESEFGRRGWTIVRQPNRYLGAARNAALAVASGEFILFMDDDNVACADEVSTFVHAAQHSGADILTCFLEVFQSRTPEPSGPPVDIWPFLGGALGPGLVRNAFGDANALFRRRVLERLGGFTEDIGVGCEDWELFARAVLSGARLEVVPRPLVRYRQSPHGMLHQTSERANRMRALRPYLELLPPPVRPLVHLARQPAPAQSLVSTAAPCLDHVQRAVVFGSGEAGRLAITLAERCGWEVPWMVDNNPAVWDKTAHGRPVRSPDVLKTDTPDLVIVASVAGKAAISAQLERMGFIPGSNFVHFLDPVKVSGTTVQLTMA